MTVNLILGTAGHIDHGKTSLIRALTGTDTDRLPEEKKRGITIELGYAVLDLDAYRLGIVDVPGHEKFVRQMLAGATGMDLALLVVAADDSVKPQTEEHLDILRLLDLSCGVIAITKCDLVEPDWLELVHEEVKEVVRGTFLEQAPIVYTSTLTGMGLDELKNQILRSAQTVSSEFTDQAAAAPFRLAIDRVFAVEGHGTVVTGSVSSGTCRTGDQLVIQPGDMNVRIREIQNHDRSVSEISRGQRGAINLAGIHHGEISRGQELSQIGYLRPSRIVSVALHVVKNASRKLKDRQRIRFHIGTNEVLGTLRLLDDKELSPGSNGYAQVFLSEPVVGVWNQPFVIRNVSPVGTIGGGRLLHPNASRLRGQSRQDLEMVKQLASDDADQRVAAAIYFSPISNNGFSELARLTGVVEGEAAIERLVANGIVVRFRLSPQKTVFMHANRCRQIGDQVCQRLRRMHQRNPLASGFERQTIESHFLYLESKEIFDFVLWQLVDQKAIQRIGTYYALDGFGPELTANEKKLLKQIIDHYATAGMAPPQVDELSKNITKNRQSVPQLIKLASDQGQLVQLTNKIYMHRDAIENIKEQLSSAMSGNIGLSLSDIRQHLNTTRKYAVPVCEYLDAIGFTRRDGDVRYLAAEPSKAS